MTAAAETDVWESVADAVRDKRARDNRARRLVRHSRIYAVAAVICLIAGMVLVAMPRIQQTLGDRAVDEQARSVSQTAALFPESSRQSVIQSAIAYNQRLYEGGQPQIGEPVFDGKTEGNFEGDAEYRRQLSVNGLDAMGEILIPKISVDMPILHGAGQDVLEHAAGHLAGTSLPIGGKNTRAVITGHSNLKGATLFTRLGELEDGDPFYIKVMGNTLAYRVTSKRIVSPTDTKSLRVHKGKDEVTLLTCTAGQYAATACHGGAQQHARSGPLARRCHGGRKKGGFCFGRHRDGDIGCRIFALSQSACRGSSYRFATDT